MNKYDKIREAIALLQQSLAEMTTLTFSEISHYVQGVELQEVLTLEGDSAELSIVDNSLELVQKYLESEDENCVTTGFNPNIVIVGYGNNGPILSLFCQPGLPTNFAYHENPLLDGKYANYGLYKGIATGNVIIDGSTVDTITIDYFIDMQPILQ